MTAPACPWLHAVNMIRSKHRRKLNNNKRPQTAEFDSSSVLYFFFFFRRCFRDEQRLSCQRRLSIECHLRAAYWVGWSVRVSPRLLHALEWEAADMHSDRRFWWTVLSRPAVHLSTRPTLRVSKQSMWLQRWIALCREWECVLQKFK